MAHLVLGAQLLGQSPPLHRLVVVRPTVLVELVQEKAVEEVALGTQALLSPLCIPVLSRQFSQE